MTTTIDQQQGLPPDYRLQIARDAGRKIVADLEALHAEPYRPEQAERRSRLLGRAWGALEELLEELDRLDEAKGGDR